MPYQHIPIDQRKLRKNGLLLTIILLITIAAQRRCMKYRDTTYTILNYIIIGLSGLLIVWLIGLWKQTRSGQSGLELTPDGLHFHQTIRGRKVGLIPREAIEAIDSLHVYGDTHFQLTLKKDSEIFHHLLHKDQNSGSTLHQHFWKFYLSAEELAISNKELEQLLISYWNYYHK